jgi:hydrogenase expression/formation protein HypE
VSQPDQPTCPIAMNPYERIVMAHGGGGLLMQQLLETRVQPRFANPYLAARQDSAVLTLEGHRYAFTTDAYVVNPIFFPGGDIGKLAVCGTLNDLAMVGARPLFLSAALIIEEGLPMDDLQRVLDSMAEAAGAAGALIVTGDTKVVERDKGDGLYITTAGLGLLGTGPEIGPGALRAGDVVLISGDIGRHGMAIMAQREGLGLETPLASDCADLSGLVQALLAADIELHCLRDLTRGGLASALIEISQTAQLDIRLDETAIPVEPAVRGLCELLGFDPLYVANEGCCVLFVPPMAADPALAILRSHPLGRAAARVGEVTAATRTNGEVHLRTAYGTERVLILLSGEQLPRIC